MIRVLRLCSVFEAPPGSVMRSLDLDVVGGMQVHAARLTAGLDRLGVAQTVVTAYRRGAPRAELLGERSLVARVGVPTRHFRQLYGPAAVREVLRHRAVDLVHVHLGEDLAVVPLARWASVRFGVPLVATVHCSVGRTLERHGARSALLRSVGGTIHQRLFARAAAILTVSERAAAELVASGIPPSRVRLVPLGIEVPADGLGHPSVSDRRSVLFVGRLVKEKGVAELLEAFARLARSYTELIVVGDGPMRGRLERLAGDLAVGDRVRFVGAVPHADVASHLARARVVVVPSWFEERGRVVLEAMANGAALVGTRTGGIAETVRDGVNGLLVPVRDPLALASAIARVLEDDVLAASLSEAGRATVADHGIERLVDATLETYEAVLGAEPGLHRAMEVSVT
jgi:glycogen(starch) synthase